MNNQRILTGNIKVNTNKFVAIKHVISKCHNSVEEIHYLVSNTRVESYRNQMILHYSITELCK